MIICFTGGRDYKDRAKFDLVVDAICHTHDAYVGCAKGLDAMVRDRYPLARVFRAEWTALGKKAGPIRNEQMLRAALSYYRDADMNPRVLLIAFPGGDGTNGCVAIAKRLGIPVMRVE